MWTYPQKTRFPDTGPKCILYFYMSVGVHIARGIYNSERKGRVNSSFQLCEVLTNLLRQHTESPHHLSSVSELMFFFSRWFSQECIAPPLCCRQSLWWMTSHWEDGVVELQLDSCGKAITLILKGYKEMGIYKIVSHKCAEGVHLSWLSLFFSACIMQPPRVFKKNKNVWWHAALWEYNSQQVSLRESVAGYPTSSVSVMSSCAGDTKQKITPYFLASVLLAGIFKNLIVRKRWIFSQSSDILVQASV